MGCHAKDYRICHILDRFVHCGLFKDQSKFLQLSESVVEHDCTKYNPGTLLKDYPDYI